MYCGLIPTRTWNTNPTTSATPRSSRLTTLVPKRMYIFTISQSQNLLPGVIDLILLFPARIGRRRYCYYHWQPQGNSFHGRDECTLASFTQIFPACSTDISSSFDSSLKEDAGLFPMANVSVLGNSPLTNSSGSFFPLPTEE